MENSPDIITIGCIEHMQRRNKLKGIAMQKIVLSAMEPKKDDLSLKKILELVSQKAADFYMMNTPFKVDDKIYNIKNEFIHISEFPEKLQVYLKHKITDKKWKICSHCGQYILAETQRTKKCLKCKKGYFRFKVEVLDEWKLAFGGGREEVLQKMCEEKILEKVSASLKKRADFFHYSDNVFYIFESKNKEKSGLSFGDLINSLVYPLIIKQCGYNVKKLVMIFNGFWTDELRQQIKEGFAKKFDFEVEFSPVKKWLEERGIKIKSVEVTKQGDGYTYQIIPGETKQIVINLEKVPEDYGTLNKPPEGFAPSTP